MANLILDDQGRPKPQYEKPDGTGFEAWEGANGAGNVRSDDGEIVTLGSTTDTSAADTVLGKLTKLLESMPTTINNPFLPDAEIAFVAPVFGFGGGDPAICEANVVFSALPEGAATEVTLAAIAAKLVTLNALLEDKFEDDVRMEYYGPTVVERPAADAVPIGAVFMAIQTQEIWQSDGAQWVVV